MSLLTSIASDGLLAMYDRCSAETRFRRWHGHVSEFPPQYLAALLAANGDQLAVVARHNGVTVGFASAARINATTREIGILVEDASQHRGVGRQLMQSLVEVCREQGTTRLQVEVLAADVGLLRPLRALGTLHSRVSHGAVTAMLELE